MVLLGLRAMLARREQGVNLDLLELLVSLVHQDPPEMMEHPG